MLVEDQEATMAAWRNVLTKLMGLLALGLMAGILFNVVVALLVLIVQRIRRKEAIRTLTKEGTMKPRAANGRAANGRQTK